MLFSSRILARLARVINIVYRKRHVTNAIEIHRESVQIIFHGGANDRFADVMGRHGRFLTMKAHDGKSRAECAN
jgi:CobQ-like glutamine amidotransferase family enzyme